MGKLSIICAKNPGRERERGVSFPAGRQVSVLNYIPGIFHTRFSIALYFKDQIAIGRHRPCLFVYDHLQLIYRRTQRFHSREDI